MKTRSRNQLTHLLAALLQNRPMATNAELWRHLGEVAHMQVYAWLRFDSTRRELVYQARPLGVLRRMDRRAFCDRMLRLRKMQIESHA